MQQEYSDWRGWALGLAVVAFWFFAVDLPDLAGYLLHGDYPRVEYGA